jgi:hypothetical protein
LNSSESPIDRSDGVKGVGSAGESRDPAGGTTSAREPHDRSDGLSSGDDGPDVGAGARAQGRERPGGTDGGHHPVIAFLRANPQVFVLLVVCLVLGLGTFLAVLISLVTAGSGQTTGEPSGVIILGAHTLTVATRPLMP